MVLVERHLAGPPFAAAVGSAWIGHAEAKVSLSDRRGWGTVRPGSLSVADNLLPSEIDQPDISSEAFVVSERDGDPVTKRIQKIVFQVFVLVSNPKTLDLLDEVVPRFSFVYPARTMTRQLDQVPKKNWTVMQQPSAYWSGLTVCCADILSAKL